MESTFSAGTTKASHPDFHLSIPRLRPGIIRRERLFSLLDRGTGGAFILIRAPAGFGKTTLVVDWLGSRRRAFAWFGIDDDHRDGISFATGIAQAVSLACGRSPAVAEIEDCLNGAADATARWSYLVQGIVADVVSLGRGCVLVIDDCHLLEDSAVTFLAKLIECLPDGATVLAAGRGILPIPLARLRVRGELVELGAAELRFNYAEAREFLSGESSAACDNLDVGLITQKTEGWAAALKMAALSLRDRRDKSSFIKSFSGARKDIFDFFAEEAFAALDEKLLRFLLDIAPLEILSGPLCAAVSGRSDAQALLRQLEDAGLFLTPLDDERRWYAFHGLFKEALMRKLEAERPADVDALRILAADWLAGAGYYVEAMRQRLHAGDAEGAALLAEGRALVALEQGSIQELGKAIANLPAGSVETHPWLGMAAAWSAVYAGRLSAAAAFANTAEFSRQGLSIRIDQDSEHLRIAGHAEAIRAYTANLEGDGIEAEARACRALDLLTDVDRIARAHAYKSLGFGLILLHRYDSAPAILGLAMVEASLAGLDHIRILAANDLAYLMILLGHLDEARSICIRELRIRDSQGREPLSAGCLHSILASIALARGNFAEAREESTTGLDLCLAWGNMDRIVFSTLTHASVLAVTGTRIQARDRLERLREQPSLTPRHAMAIAIATIEIDPLHEESDRIVVMGETKDENSGILLALAHATYLSAKRRPAEAMAIAIPALERSQRWGHAIHSLALLAIVSAAEHALGRVDEARTSALQALAIAEATGDVYQIASRGPSFMSFLEGEGLLRGSTGARLTEAFDYLHGPREYGSDNRSGERLSPREREILSLLAKGMNTDDMAPALFIAPSTVRSHVKNLYAKLGVHCRVEAVNRARESGIL